MDINLEWWVLPLIITIITFIVVYYWDRPKNNMEIINSEPLYRFLISSIVSAVVWLGFWAMV